jgi:hypothetical protein
VLAVVTAEQEAMPVYVGAEVGGSPPGCAAWRTRQHRRQEQMNSYDVRFWAIKKLAGNGSGGRLPVVGAEKVVHVMRPGGIR